MHMLETTLLTGPYDWDETLMPRAEFAARIGAARAIARQHSCDGLIVGGTSPEHGALGYLTGFVPKLGPALAFIPGEGEPRIVFSGGGAMLSSAQRLTFISDVRAMRDPGQEFAAWLGETRVKRLGLWGDYAIAQEVRHALDRNAPSPLVVLDAELDALRRRKSERESGLIVRASEIVGLTLGELRTATGNGRGVRTAAIAAERVAYARGAQDVRMLVGKRDGGTPEPIIGTHDPQVDPLLACIAVRFAGYWAEGCATITAKRSAALVAVETARAAVIAAIKPGAVPSRLHATARDALGGLQVHPIVAASLGNGLGVSREEIPLLGVRDSSPLQDGDVCALRFGAVADATDSAIVSAMVRVGPKGAELVWR